MEYFSNFSNNQYVSNQNKIAATTRLDRTLKIWSPYSLFLFWS